MYKRQHPDWVLKASERDVVLGRGGTQVVLDLANPAVQDFVFGVVDNLDVYKRQQLPSTFASVKENIIIIKMGA